MAGPAGRVRLAIVWRIRSAWRRVSGKTAAKSRSALAAAGTAAALFLMAVTGRGGPANGPTTVYISAGPAESPAKPIALAPPDLLDQLHALGRPEGPGAVLLNAEYNGNVVEGQAEFDAVFQVYCRTDEPTTVAIPLDGVQLTGDVLLDGRRSRPRPFRDRRPASRCRCAAGPRPANRRTRSSCTSARP